MNDMRSDGHVSGCEQYVGHDPTVFGEALKSVALSMGHMLHGIRAIEQKMDRTEETLRTLTEGLKLQGQRMLKLEQRINNMEENLPSIPMGHPVVQSASNVLQSNSGQASCHAYISASPSSSLFRSVSSDIDHGSSKVRSTTGAKTDISARHSDICAQRNSSLGRRLLAMAQEGRAEDVQKLLDAGTDVNYSNNSKWTALQMAASKGFVAVVVLLLKAGADVRAKNSYGCTALHMAAHNDFRGRCANALILAGSDVSSRNRSGRTPLHTAAERGNIAVVRKLMQAGADNNAKDDQGRTPFNLAKTQFVRRLLFCAV